MIKECQEKCTEVVKPFLFVFLNVIPVIKDVVHIAEREQPVATGLKLRTKTTITGSNTMKFFSLKNQFTPIQV